MMKGGTRLEDFAKLYKLYAEPLYRYLLYMCGDVHLAEELLAETYYQAFISIHRFKGKSKESTWLYQISKHVYLKHHKKKARGKTSPSHYLSDLVETTTPEALYIKKEEYQLLVRAIHTLQ